MINLEVPPQDSSPEQNKLSESSETGSGEKPAEEPIDRITREEEGKLMPDRPSDGFFVCVRDDVSAAPLVVALFPGGARGVCSPTPHHFARRACAKARTPPEIIYLTIPVEAVGDRLAPLMREHPQNNMTILCGHTHSPVSVRVLDNLSVFAGEAKYFHPRVQRVFDLA